MPEMRNGNGNLEARIHSLDPWFHNLRLQGIQTAPDHFLGDYPLVKFERFRGNLPEDMAGMSVLDIGCNGGFYSLEMKRRGADRVVGIDSDEHYLRQARFAAEISELDIHFQKLSVWDIASLRERFDLVIFMGVFYHLRHPLLALDLIHQHVTKDLLLFQSMQRGSQERILLEHDYSFDEVAIFGKDSFPKMYFIEKKYSHDETNWWIPNRSGMEAMLRSAGFDIEQQPEEEVYFCRRREILVPPDGIHCVYPAASSDSERRG